MVIEGWDIGCLDMCIGEKTKLLPPGFGYGKRRSSLFLETLFFVCIKMAEGLSIRAGRAWRSNFLSNKKQISMLN